MILLLGPTGYIGQAFARELRRRGEPFVPLSRSALDYSDFELLWDYLRKLQPDFVINAASYSGTLYPDAVRYDRFVALHTNTFLPRMLSHICTMQGITWAHVSSGDIYSGAKVYEHRRFHVEKDLNRPDLRRRFDAHPEFFFGFTEDDAPNCCFRQPPCNFYSGTKALGEEAIEHDQRHYVWRFKSPFDEQAQPCNWLSQIKASASLADGVNSLSHLGDCVRVCLDLWKFYAPFGTYNVTNPGVVTTRHVVERMQRTFRTARRVRWLQAHEQLADGDAELPPPNCILDVSKLLRLGVKLRPVTEALEEALEKWQPAETGSARSPRHSSAKAGHSGRAVSRKKGQAAWAPSAERPPAPHPEPAAA